MNTEKNLNEEIARVAYGLYEKRGYVNGNDFSDWVEAEKIVLQKNRKTPGGNGKGAKSATQSKPSKR